MTINEFIEHLKKLNSALAVENGKLILKGYEKKLTDDELQKIKKDDFIINYIKENKNELIEYISISGDPVFEKKSKDISSIYRLSGLQQGMLFHGLYNDGGGAYIRQLSCILFSPDIEAFRKSWNFVIKNHSALRSAFYHDTFNVPVQSVFRDVVLPVEIIDYRDKSTEEQSCAIKEYEEADRHKGFDFKSAPLMRISLIRLNEDRYRMIWTWHHLLFDGWSMPVLMEEFLSSYEQLVSGKQIISKSEEDCFEDYIRYIDGKDKKKEEKYWRDYLKNIEQSTYLPFIETTKERNKEDGTYKTLLLQTDENITSQIQSYAQSNRLTINTIMQGVWSYLLHLYTGSSDIAYGIIVSGRPDDLPRVEQRVGMYINTLPLRSIMKESQGITQWLQSIQNDQVSSLKYQYTPLSTIQGLTNVKSDLFDSLLVFENYPISKVTSSKKWSLSVEDVKIHERTNYPLTIEIDSASKIKITFSYNADILNQQYIDEIKSHFENVLIQMTGKETEKLSDIELITKSEKKQLLSVFNDLSVTYPQDKTIIDLFEEQASKTPDNIAVVSGREELTYKELDEQSNQLAHYLQSKGVKKETLVPICIERGFDMIVGILGILKAGGVYVPVDPEYPEDRIKYIIEDTSASIVVSSSESSLKLPPAENINIIKIDKDRSKINKKSSGNLKTSVKPHNAAYIIYTSGSTGKPKGVIVEQCNVVRLFKTDKPLFDFTEKDVWTMFHSFCFDFTVWEMYGALFYGGKLVIVPKEVTRDAVSFSELLLNEKVTILNQIPSSFYALQENIVENKIPLNVRYLIFGGEALDPAKLRQWKHVYPNCKIINMYGITETTVHVTYQEIEQKHIESGNSIIGKPIPTLSLYILDRNQKLLPIGIAGELCIGGAGLARGYLNRPELTEERFIKNPYSEENGARLYRSGDLGKRLPDGNIEYLGRIDEQVKIRGYRIELGEIESVLNDCKQVRQAIVLAKEDKESNRYLIAYIIPEGKFEREEIKSYLKGKLPEYMVPSLWVEMESFPIASSGKINKKALPDPDASTLISNEYIEPKTEAEIKTANIWKEVLNVERVGINDNFFELGGDSIKVIRVIHKIRKAFNKELKVFDIYHSGTLSELVKLIENDTLSKNSSDENLRAAENEIAKLKEELLSSIPDAGNIEDIYPMSDIQSGMVFASQENPETALYHDQFVFKLSKKIDLKIFEKALELMVRKHSILRTEFNLEIHTEGIQIVNKSIPLKVEHFEIPDASEEEAKNFIKDYLRAERAKPFEINEAPLWRATLIYLKNQTLFLFQFHHAILDGWSVASFNTELNNLYLNLLSKPEQKSLPAVMCTYKDYILESIIEKKNFGNRDFWLNEMSDYKRLDIFSKEPVVQRLNKEFSKDFLNALSKKTKEDGISVKGLFLGAYLYSLKMLTYKNELTVGLVTNTRPVKEDGDKVLGCFLNTIPFRFKFDQNPLTWKNYFEQIENKIKELKKRDRATLPDIVKITGEKSPDENPFFDVIFNFVNFHVYENLGKGLAEFDQTGANEAETKWNESNDDNFLGNELTNTYLDFTTRITGNTLSAGFSLRKNLKSGKSLKDMAGYMEKIIKCYLENSGENISAGKIIPDQELELMLNDFNDTEAESLTDKTIIDLFEEQVKKTPDNTAVVFGDQQLTYKELNERSNKLAHYLQSKGLKEDVLVPVCIKRSMEMIIGILGILKAGRAYVPIDPEYPEERIKYLIKDTGAVTIVSSKEDRTKFSELKNIEIIELDGDQSKINKQPGENPQSAAKPHNLAYVIYTSGSTGHPKGVMIEHKSLFNYLLNNKTRYVSNEKTNSGSFIHLSFTFDASITGMFMPLINGKSIIISSRQSLDIFEDENLLKYAPYDFIKITPSHFELIQPKIKTSTGELLTKRLVIGGEALLQSHFKYLTEKGVAVEIINEYGPTEATVGCSVYSLDTLSHTGNSKNEIPIGKPIDNVQLYILNEEKEMLPLGVAGEMCIGGNGLARGYLNLPELTAEKFIKNPFDKTAESKLYRTGDLGRWSENGNIEYLGRIDEQIKIGGYRIELGEIESVLSECEFVRQSVVIAKEDEQGNKRLAAYIVPTEIFDKEKLKNYLQEKLPSYMIPALWVEMESLPLTQNGKIDRRSLPEPDSNELISKDYTAPRNEFEEKLALIWKDLLHVERVGIYDNFLQLGGDSIISIQIVSRVRRFGYELKPRDIIIHQTIAGLSEKITEQSASAVLAEQGLLTGDCGLLPVQQSYFEEADNDISYFNQGVLLTLDKSITAEVLTKVIEQLTSHHDSLRFRYYKKDGEWHQEYGAYSGLLNVVDLQSADESTLGNLIREHSDRYQCSLDIEKGEVIKFVFFQTPEREIHNRIFIVIHHLVMDGVSWRILLDDFELLLTGILNDGKAELGNKTSSYRQWYNALEQYGQSKRLLPQSLYWEYIVSSYEPFKVEMEYDGPVKSKDIEKIIIKLDALQTLLLLKEVPQVYHTEIDDILLCALSLTLCDWGSTEKIIVGMEGHGRENITEIITGSIDTSRTVGWFTSQYPVLLDLSSGMEIADAIKSVKEQLRKIPDKGLGYGVLRYINKDENLEGKNCRDIVFNYLGQIDNVVSSSKLFSEAKESKGADTRDDMEVKYRLSVNSMIKGGELTINLGYSRLHYRKETIEDIAEKYKSIIKLLISHCMEQQKTGAVHTPSDYGLGSEVSYEELDQFLKKNDKEDIISF